jgi:hypothetical protein
LAGSTHPQALVGPQRQTHPPKQIENLQIEHLRRMPVRRKPALVAAMNQAVREMAVAGLRQRHPDDSPAQQRRRLADLLLGEELAARVYGPAPDET